MRAEKLLATESPGTEMLRFYLDLLQLQEPIYQDALSHEWSSLVVRARDDAFPVLQLDRLPFSDLLGSFQKFLRDVGPRATEVLAPVAESLWLAGDDLQTRVLRDFVLRAEAEAEAEASGDSLPGDAPHLEFFARAFLEPVVQALVEQSGRTVDAWRRNTCPMCGRPPQVGAIHDEPDAKGRRMLVCSLCGTWWTFPRSTCPQCGETDPNKLIYHECEDAPHVRVDECAACKAYLKSVDLRKDGRAVPLVDDLATVELDVWCGERGLRKIQPNLLGM